MEELGFINPNRYEVRSHSLRDLLAIVFRHRRLMGLSFFGILAGAVLVAVLQPSRYEAGMRILVKPGRADTVATPEAPVTQLAAAVTEEDLNSEVELLKSRDLLEKVVRTCDLQNRGHAWSRVLAAISRYLRQKPQEDKRIATAVHTLQKELNVEAVKKTNLIAVNYESTDPELASRVLNTLSNLYLEKNVAVHRQPEAFGFFQQQTQQYRQRLADAETNLADYTQSASVVSAQLEKEAALQKLAEFEATQKQTNAAIAEAQQRIRILQEQAASMPARMVTQVRKADDALILSQLRSNLLTLELKRTELLEKFAPTYRSVQEVDAQIAQTSTALSQAEKSQLNDETTDRDPAYEWVRGELARVKSELAGLQARAEATARTVKSYRANAQSLERKQIIQDDLIRTAKATEESYLLYLRKEEEARISDALDRRRIINVAVVEAATVPSLPSNHRGLTVLAGLLLATLTSLGLAFGSEQLDRTFRTPDEVRLFLNIPVLAVLPENAKDALTIHVS